jgi:cell division transport system permease protein
MKLRVIVAEALRSIRVSMSTTVAATTTVLIGMFLLGISIALGSWVLSWSHHVKKSLVVDVFFCVPYASGCKTDATALEIRRVQARLRAMPEVKTVQFISKAQALAIERKRHPEFTKDLPSNPLPASLKVTPKHGEDVELIAGRLQPTPPGVQKVDYGKAITRRVLRVAKVIELVFLVAVIILVAASTLLIANTIRLSIFARRREIEVMKLVGASNWFVRGPFMLEGLICGLGGSAAAVVLLLLGKVVAMPAILGHVNAGSDVKAIQFELNALVVLGTGLLLGAMGSGLTLRRFLKI